MKACRRPSCPLHGWSRHARRYRANVARLADQAHIDWAAGLVAPQRQARRDRQAWLHATMAMRYGQGQRTFEVPSEVVTHVAFYDAAVGGNRLDAELVDGAVWVIGGPAVEQ